jgi:RNA polymerase sigma-70 factor (ECF subfamily)
LRVFETEFDYIYRTLRRNGLSASDAEDLTQEVFLVVWRRRAHFDARRPLRPWIAGIIYRIVHGHRRLRAREVLADDLDAPDEGPGPDEQVAAARARQLVLRALPAVPVKQRAVLVMHDLDGLAMRDIADALSVPLFTLYTQLRAGRLAFAREVRRAQLLSALEIDLRGADPQLLLASERPLPPAPPRVRERALRRLKAVLLLPLGAENGATPRPAATGAGRRPRADSTRLGWLGVGALSGAVGLALLVLVADPGLPDRPPRASVVAERAGAPAPAAVRAWLPALRRARAAPRIAPLRLAQPDRRPGPPSLLRGLLGYWRFDDGPGSERARDLSGAGQDCRLRRLDPQGAWGEGALSGGLTLDGRGWLECPNSEPLTRLDGALTIAAWVTPGQRLRNYKAVVSRQMERGRLDELLFGFVNGALVFSSHAHQVRLVQPLPPDRRPWVHIAVTRQDDGLVRLHADGVEIARARSAPGTPPASRNPLIIGASFNDTAARKAEARFDGAIDELLLYRRALTADELRVLAARRQPPVPL